jgi:arylsulfatase A-like enzyme
MGYRNHYFGKWHVSPEHTPIDFGYETYVSPSDYRAFRTKKYGSYKKGDWFGGIDNVPTKDSPTHWLAEAAAQTIRGYEGKDEPWHISLMFSEPHLPCKPTKEFYDLYDPAQIPEWAGFRENFENKPYIQRQQLCSWGVEDYTWEDWREIVARYYAVITQMDDAIGKVLDALEESGQLENTLVVFCSDHGDMCGSHRMMDKHYVLYDDVVRVPLLISLPGFSMEDCVEEAFVYQTLDLGPTIMEILGETLQQTDGRSLLPLLTGEPCADWRKEVVATYNGQQFGLYTQRMIRTNEWKYIWNTTDVDELYDMVQDQGELHNRIYDPACQAVLSDLRKRLYEALKEQKDFLAASEFAGKQLLGQVKKI